jgi:hypothetical protein
LRWRSSWHNLPHNKRARRSEKKFVFFLIKKIYEKNNDDNQEGGGGLEWGVVIRKRRGTNRLFCFGFFLVSVKNLLSSSSSSSAVFWVFFIFLPNLFCYLLFWGDITRRPAIAQLPIFFNSDATSGFWIGVIINGFLGLIFRPMCR